MIIGHQNQWAFLRRLVENKRVPQAMLFCGPEQVGKRKVALEFIKLLGCDDLDVHLIEPQERQIQIDQIRDLQKVLNLQPLKSEFKIGLIDNAEALNSQAQNCFLKTLEEPKGKTLLILITSHPETLAATLRSRTQILKFYPLKGSEMVKYFKGRDLLLLSEGRPGKAIEFTREPDKLKQELRAYQECQRILDAPLEQRFTFAKQLLGGEKAQQKLKSFLNLLLKYLRRLLLDGDFSQALKNKIEAVEELRVLSSYTNINPKLALENLFIKL